MTILHCHSKSFTQSLIQKGTFLIRHTLTLSCTLSCFTLSLSHNHSDNLSHCHSVTLLFWQSTSLSLCHFVTLALSQSLWQSITLSHCHSDNLPHCHSVTLSLLHCCSVTVRVRVTVAVWQRESVTVMLFMVSHYVIRSVTVTKSLLFIEYNIGLFSILKRYF